jgi:hypothetical protein
MQALLQQSKQVTLIQEEYEKGTGYYRLSRIKGRDNS